ncbi:MAG TPA: YHS domain-containing (seleno)protein [Flavisolibacter sp.]|nr:YHS domain-containing (seleno)protein [Flavisolibacter sp.]
MKKLVTVVSILICFTMKMQAQQSEVFISEGKAIRGYDPVAYFKEGKPVKGQDSLTYSWKGGNWYFSSRQNLDSFKKNPVQYAPQYGGYCAYGCSEGHKAPTQPDAWSIVNGKLYFNYNQKVKAIWIKDTDSRIITADKNWEAIRNKE